MLASVFSCAPAGLIGLDGAVVQVPVDLNTKSLPPVTNRHARRCREGIYRARARRHLNSALPYPRGHLAINLAPAGLRKEGPACDDADSRPCRALLSALPQGIDTS